MATLEQIRNAIPEPAKDIRLNLTAVLDQSALSAEQRWGVAVASAIAARNPALREAVLGAAKDAVSAAVIEDAIAAASLMAMNNVYYRFRHVIGQPVYADKPARLRMQRLARPAGSKVDFELFCLAVSAINGCEACLLAHEKVVVDAGLTADHVHDAIRIAATVQASAVALEAA
jgi:alkyl hydroperoxide reductase subunit D